MKVQIVVTHLLGTGHLARAVALAAAFVQAGHTVLVVSGGMPVPRLKTTGIDFHQLPSLRSDGVDFTNLLDSSDGPASNALFLERKKQLVDTTLSFSPDVLITELFPFGRRILKDEFLTFLDAAKAMSRPPKILASIRDILAPPSKPKKALFAEQTIMSHYDAVLVHSDPDLTPLELSWPVSEELRRMLRYTGFVAPRTALPHPTQFGQSEVIVSAGGGSVGMELFECAGLAASIDRDRQWRILVGGQGAVDRIADLKAGAPENLIVEPVRPDFRQMLHHAAASVSFCGYNTAQDLLQTSCPAVFVPFDAGNEVEQGLRSEALSHLAGFEVLRSAELTATALLEKVNQAIASPRRAAAPSANGAQQTVEIVDELVSEVAR